MTTFVSILPDGKITTRNSSHSYTYILAVKWPGGDWGAYRFSETRQLAAKAQTTLINQVKKNYPANYKIETELIPCVRG